MRLIRGVWLWRGAERSHFFELSVVLANFKYPVLKANALLFQTKVKCICILRYVDQTT